MNDFIDMELISGASPSELLSAGFGLIEAGLSSLYPMSTDEELRKVTEDMLLYFSTTTTQYYVLADGDEPFFMGLARQIETRAEQETQAEAKRQEEFDLPFPGEEK